ncbi:hypothetical protein [Marinilactibacillus sp. Marseille-P9653]|uniref:hypothetical protein n=1 Tax=Marinilactibacillus sp. Marseille-P9653 TaxID=2866583 RepID=UPI001CE42383|nr:hypothetical protein [Marinilactibacillus sp. Marseille-P9653]
MGHIGESAFIESNFRCEFGFNVYIGPRVGIYTGDHAEAPVERADGGVYAKPVTIGDKVWLCGNVKIAQNITVGENSIIGMGSVVLNDVPPNALAAGNPCKVIRPIKESDIKWQK